MTALSAPFPYFGGKRRAAEVIWAVLGDVGGYVEPFSGSAAVLLARPALSGRRVETINDLDGWLVNMWRAVRLAPDAVAEHASGPVTEIDYHARLAWLQERRTDGLVSWLEGGPEVFSAFGGVGSELYVAVKHGRRALGIELKASYWRTGVEYLEDLERELAAPKITDHLRDVTA